MAHHINPFDPIYAKLDALESLIIGRAKKETTVTQSKELSGDTFISKEKVSEIYGVSHVTIWDWEKKGILQSYRIGNLKRFKLSEVMTAPVPIKRTISKSKEAASSRLIKVA